MNCKEAKDLVIKAGLELVSSGLIARTWGNVSCRIDGETFVITPSGRDYLSLMPEDIVEVKISDLSYEGSVKPSSEKGIHAEVYRRLADMNFVIHTHQENASALSAAGIDKIPLAKSLPSFSESIICAEYALPGTKSLRKNVAAALVKTKSNAVILKHHGALCFGRDYASTMKTAYDLEEICGEFITERSSVLKAPHAQDPELIISLLEARKHNVLKEKGGFVLINTDPDVLRYAALKNPLRPFLDDFAQIIGLKVQVAENKQSLISKALRHSSAVLIKDTGALCWGKDERDAGAVSMILRKNCKAYFAAAIFGSPKAISPMECALMRYVYLKKYSKLSEK